MNYLYITKNSQQDLGTMNGYSGTKLLHTDPSFLIWLWTNPLGPDLGAAQDAINPSINVVAMTVINVI